MTDNVKQKMDPQPKPALKKFDAVKMMREIRDRIDKDKEGMTFEEQKAYMKRGKILSK